MSTGAKQQQRQREKDRVLRVLAGWVVGLWVGLWVLCVPRTRLCEGGNENIDYMHGKVLNLSVRVCVCAIMCMGMDGGPTVTTLTAIRIAPIAPP